MSEPKVTPWFPADVKPVRIGWYQRDYGDKLATSAPDWWNGQAWHIGYGDGGVPSTYQSSRTLPWRGLASDPAKAKKVSP